ncbi:MAG: GAF domain-containing sensor histidine kinase [Prolixibacteraceae bacterium]
MENRKSTIFVRETSQQKTVNIGSRLKPEFVSEVVQKWQSLIDVTAKIVNVPSGLIMKLNEDSIEVFVKSQTDGNPYEAGEEAKLIYGLYCEMVIGTQKQLLVPDATKSKVWKDNNPDVDINMISYLGLPINWPDGEVFGTVCLLDNKENRYNPDYIKLLNQVKNHIETDLKLLVANKELAEKNSELEQMNTIKSRFLSLISHDVRGGIGVLDEFLKLTIENIDNYDKPRLKMILQSLSQNAGSAYQTLESLLRWSKNDLLQLEPDKNPVNVVQVIENLLHYFHQSLLIKDIEVVKEFSSAKIFIQADENMLIASLRNILSNAVKFNQTGGKIFIRVSQYGDKTHIELEDTGIGMSPEKLNELFTYKKEDTGKGAGIGLILAKDFLDKNDATLKVESEPGKKTKFIITV